MKRLREGEESPTNNQVKTVQVNNQPRFKKLRVEDAFAYLEQVKNTFKDKPQIYAQFLEVMKEFKSQKIDTPGVIGRVTEIFKGNHALILGFNTFLPPGFKIESSQLQDTEKKEEKPSQIDFDQAIKYVTKIKSRFSNDIEKYKRFLAILHSFQQEKITIKKVFEQVSELFKDDQDLLDEFTQFLPINQSVQKTKKVKKEKKKPAPTAKRTSARKAEENIKKQNDESQEETNNGMESSVTNILFEKIKNQLGNNDTYQEFLKCVNLYSTGVIGKQDLIKFSEGMIGGFPELFKGFKKIVSSSSSMLEEKFEKGKEAALKQSSKYGPSYRLLPKNFPQPICSERDALCNEVLNDEFVSVVAGSEEGGSDVSRKSQADEILFQCEDDRCELDIVIEQNESTIIFMTPLAEKIEKENSINFKLENLRDIHRASIARIYGDKGNEILEGLRKNPTVAISIILKRLKQKDQEWRTARVELNKFWKEVYEKNYKKSFEIRSSDFKNSEKKTLTSKAILQDIEEMNTYSKVLELEMKDQNIHNDILFILLNIKEVSKEEEKFKELWKEFILPLFINQDFQIKNTFEPIKEEKDEKKKKNLNLFYSNSNIYLFIRYYMLLYERLVQAKELATEIVKNEEGREHEFFKKEEKENQNKKFLNCIISFLNNEIESLKFENECKEMLGYQSYIVHTFDKLITSLYKQGFIIFNDSKSTSLIKGFKYEFKRENSFIDSSYLYNSLKIINDKTYCIEMNLESSVLTCSIVDTKLKNDKDKLISDSLKYVESFIDSSDSIEDSKLFLKRTLINDSKPKLMMNGLESKVCLVSQKMIYIEGTEDYHFIKKPKYNHKDKKEWLEKWSKDKVQEL